MIVDRRQLVGSPKQVGTLNGRPVMLASTKGGFQMIVDSAGKPLGTGSHPCIARVVAKKRCPDIKFTQLEKGGWVSPESIEWLTPKWEAITDRAEAVYDSMHAG